MSSSHLLKRAMLPCATVLLHCLRWEKFTTPLQQPRYQTFVQASREAFLRPQCLMCAWKVRGQAGMTAIESAKNCRASNQRVIQKLYE